MNIKQASVALDMSEMYVRTLCRKGTLDHTRDGMGRIDISSDACAAFLSMRTARIPKTGAKGGSVAAPLPKDPLAEAAGRARVIYVPEDMAKAVGDMLHSFGIIFQNRSKPSATFAGRFIVKYREANARGERWDFAKASAQITQEEALERAGLTKKPSNAFYAATANSPIVPPADDDTDDSDGDDTMLDARLAELFDPSIVKSVHIAGGARGQQILAGEVDDSLAGSVGDLFNAGLVDDSSDASEVV